MRREQGKGENSASVASSRVATKGMKRDGMGYLFKLGPSHFHRGEFGRNLDVHLEGFLQDFTHVLRLDQGVMLGEVAVKFLHLVFQALNLGL